MSNNQNNGYDEGDEDDYIDFSDTSDDDEDKPLKELPTPQGSEHKSQYERMVEDLANSGLTPEDIDVQVLDNSHRATMNLSTNMTGYALMYRSISGSYAPFYRIRLFDRDPKYKQQKGQPNHIYIPKTFMSLYNRIGKKFIMLTEGEKKAAKLCKEGFPAVAVTGVDSWRNRFINIPSNFEVVKDAKKNMLTFKVGDAGWDPEHYSGVATYFDDIINMLYRDRSQLIMVYDSDPKGSKAYYGTQRAAASLGFELRHRGIEVTHIRQLMLPNNTQEKIGVDDYIMSKGKEEFIKLFKETISKPTAFPQFPNIREYIAKSLGKPRLSRKQYQQICISIMADLDRRGKRMYANHEEQLYYFNRDNNHLMTVPINDDVGSSINATEFGKLLYKSYDISPMADRTIMQWLGTMIMGEQPIEDVKPARVFSRSNFEEDVIRFQLNEGEFIKVTGNPEKPVEFLKNGDDNTLFVSEGIIPIDSAEFKKALEQVSKRPLNPWWFKVFEDVKLKEGQNAQAMGLLYYISPWLYRWRGTQLPVEMVCGEPGSGKSTLVSLRLNILNGNASLKNAPTDLKEWYATLSKTGGMYVTDNLHFTDRNLAQRMSDEICRLVTEPEPTIEQRRLYTNTGVVKIPVNAIFSFTAVKQPFSNADIIQRSFILELDKAQALKSNNGELSEKDFAFDSYWLQHQIDKFGGRTMWLAHHIWVLHKFFALVKEEWDPRYKAKYRLINLEQIMTLMSKVFDIDPSWIPNYLSTTTNDVISRSDWVLEGLKAYATMIANSTNPDKEFNSSEMAIWFNSQEAFEENQILTSQHALGRYLQASKFNIATISGIVESRKYANRQLYKVLKIRK